MPYAKADPVQISITSNENSKILAPDEKTALGRYIKQCRLWKKDLQDTREAFETCSEKSNNEAWYQSTPAIVGFVIMGFVTGFLIAPRGN